MDGTETGWCFWVPEQVESREHFLYLGPEREREKRDLRMQKPRARPPSPGASPVALTCGRVSRERPAPGATRARELPAIAQFLLLVLPPPALGHGRGGRAQAGGGGRAPRGPRRPSGSLGEEGLAAAAPDAADSTCKAGRAARGPSRVPPPPGSLSPGGAARGRVPFPAPQSGRRPGLASPRLLLGEGFRAAPRAGAARPLALPKST